MNPFLIGENITDHYKKIDFTLSDTNEILCADQYIMEHKNGLFVIGLSEKHFLCNNKDKYKITNIEFVSNKSENDKQVSKKKKNCIKPNTIICNITFNDNYTIPITSHVKGKLIEINDRINENPSIVALKPINYGFLAIIDPNDVLKKEEQRKELISSFISRNNYYI
ncbi:hypothetical protein ABK040_010919 [Willaertia magna]